MQLPFLVSIIPLCSQLPNSSTRAKHYDPVELLLFSLGTHSTLKVIPTTSGSHKQGAV